MFWSAFVSLQLAITGSGALPVPHAFANLGFVGGTLLCLLVAALNYLATLWLIEAAAATATDDGTIAKSYSDLTRRAKFPRFASATCEVASTALLAGSFAASLAACAENFAKAFGKTDEFTAWISLAVVVLVGAQSYDRMTFTSSLGVAYLLVLVGLVCFEASQVEDRRKITGNVSEAPRAFAALGYAFYLAPVALSLLSHLEQGESRRDHVVSTVKTASAATFACTTIIYLLLGIAGAYWLGPNTPGDVATAFPSRQFAACTGLYLSLSLTTVVNPLRDSIRGLGGGTIATAGVILGAGFASSRASSLHLFALTGATAVCVTCYVVPVAAHLALAEKPRRCAAYGTLLVGLAFSSVALYCEVVVGKG